MESSRTSLASRTSSRTHFEVLGLGLKASSPRKLPCPWLEDSTIFEPLKFRWKTPETLRKICKDLFLGFLKYRSPEKSILKTFFFWRALASVSLVLGLNRFCPWPWPRHFFVALASSLTQKNCSKSFLVGFSSILGRIHSIRFFLNSFLASIVGKIVQVYDTRDNENQCLESLAEFLRGNRTELNFACGFSKSHRFHRRKLNV